MAVRQLDASAVDKVWGRSDIPDMFGAVSRPDGPIGEIWFADRPESALLIKYIFTSEKLSIQVHPSDDQARAAGYQCGKDESWYVIDAAPDAVIGAGFDNQLTKSELHEAALDGSIDALLTWHPVVPGDFFYVPAGTVHAIGAGVSLLEIQQNVDLTYRLFDYGRPRELQLQESLAAATPRPFVRQPRSASARSRETLADGRKFVVERLRGPARHEIVASAADPVWLMPMTDGCTIAGLDVPGGTVWLADAPMQVELGSSNELIAACAGSSANSRS